MNGMTTPPNTGDAEALDKLYNPSISDLELEERHNRDATVVYLESAKQLLRVELEKQKQTLIKTILAEDVPERKHTWDYSDQLTSTERIAAVNAHNSVIKKMTTALHKRLEKE